MAGKGLAIASHRLGYALDKLSKNALIDIIADRATAEVGEDCATDEMLANTIQEWIEPVTRVRGDRRVELRSLLVKLDQIEENYRRRQQPHKCARCDAITTGGDLCLDCSQIGKHTGPSQEAMEAALKEQLDKPYTWI
jgi:uncharacterized protein (UPF0210 family)